MPGELARSKFLGPESSSDPDPEDHSSTHSKKTNLGLYNLTGLEGGVVFVFVMASDRVFIKLIP